MLTILFAYALLRVSDLGAIITNIIAIKTATAGSVASIACSSRHIQIAGFVFSTVMVSIDQKSVSLFYHQGGNWEKKFKLF